MTSLKIKAFGITRELLGEGQVILDMDEVETVGELRKELEKRYPKLKALKSLLIAVNNAYAEEDCVIGSTDEIALIPPVSGG